MGFPGHFLALMTAAPILARVIDTTSFSTSENFQRKAVSAAIEQEIRDCLPAQRP